MSQVSHQKYWLSAGKIVSEPTDSSGEPLSDRAILQSSDLVKVETSPNGTELCWIMFAANWSSLFFAKDWLSSLTAPYTLRFFNLGWFSEIYTTSGAAASRLEHLIGKSDVRFSSRVFMKSIEPQSSRAKSLIREAFEAGEVPEEKSIVCAIDTNQERTTVMHVGPQSALASVWGMSPVAYPCLTGHSYDKLVSRAYFDVVKTGMPHYDHVLAAMTQPDGEVKWLGYERLIMPGRAKFSGFPTVSILCQFGAVDIPIL